MFTVANITKYNENGKTQDSNTKRVICLVIQ